MAALMIPVSCGELLDKITILEIKSSRLNTQDARLNVEKELVLLNDILSRDIILDEKVIALKHSLMSVNIALWDLLDSLRVKEAQEEFDAEFIDMARHLYIYNDERARIKRQINIALSSDLIEEKNFSLNMEDMAHARLGHAK